MAPAAGAGTPPCLALDLCPPSCPTSTDTASWVRGRDVITLHWLIHINAWPLISRKHCRKHHETLWKTAKGAELWKEEVNIRLPPFPGLCLRGNGNVLACQGPGCHTQVGDPHDRRGLGRLFSCDSSCKPRVTQPQPETAPIGMGERSSHENASGGHFATGRR